MGNPSDSLQRFILFEQIVAARRESRRFQETFLNVEPHFRWQYACPRGKLSRLQQCVPFSSRLTGSESNAIGKCYFILISSELYHDGNGGAIVNSEDCGLSA